jgi:uncharacterized protein YecT (DUF1311 family)
MKISFPRWVRRAATAALLAGTPATAQAASSPTGLPLGEWRVQAVHVDGERTSRMAITPNDPAWVGRRISSTAEQLTIEDTDGDVCHGPSATVQATTFPALMAATMGARPEGAPNATPADYQLPAISGQVRVYWIACRSGYFGPPDFQGHPNAWLVQYQHGLLIGWADHTVLAAASASDTAASGPSFDCAKAASAAEHAICQSPDLSAADRSIAAAYRNAQYWCDNDPAKLAALAKMQKGWVQTRNACKSSATCLAHSMTGQTTKLSDPGSFLGE